MSSEEPTITAPEETADAAGHGHADEHDRSIGEIRQDFSRTVKEIKNKFGLLLELRDRRIEELEEELARQSPQARKTRLVVLDDAESTAEILNRYVQGQHVEVVHLTGEQADELVVSEDYDIIMIEATHVIQPDVDGLALCRRLCEAGRQDRVIVMSSRPGDAVKNCVEETGAAFLRKPFRRKQVVELIGGIPTGGAK